MIDLLCGHVKAINSSHLTLMINGVGYAVFVPEISSFLVDQQVTLYIHFHWNQENGPSLYGFEDPLEKQIFQLIISCPGIGPKIGLAALSKMPAATFVAAIVGEDVKALSSISGIGLKKAEGMLVYLKNKVEKLVLEQPQVIAGNNAARYFTELSQALTALNYSRMEVSAALDHVRSLEESKNLIFDGLLRKALVYLSKRV